MRRRGELRHGSAVLQRGVHRFPQAVFRQHRVHGVGEPRLEFGEQRDRAFLPPSPLCHRSCRLDTSVTLGALRNDSGAIQQRIQRAGGGAAATA